MSIRKMELGRIRNKLINTSEKIDKSGEEVNK